MQSIDSVRQWAAPCVEITRLLEDAIQVMLDWNSPHLGQWHLFIALAQSKYENTSFESMLGLASRVDWNAQFEALILRDPSPPRTPATTAYDVGTYFIYAHADACFIRSPAIQRENVLLAFVTRPLSIPSTILDRLGIDRREVISRVVRDHIKPQFPLTEQYYVGLLEHMSAMRVLYEKELIKHLPPSG